MSRFQSKMAGQMDLFIKQKHALGFSYTTEERILQGFDILCSKSFPAVETVTREICNAWAIHRDTESKCGSGYLSRLTVVREFARFLLRSGIDAFVIPAEYGSARRRNFVPHIFTDNELELIFNASDQLEPSRVYKTAHICAPVMLRLLFACGLRPQEARIIKTCDVDLTTGVIKISESKNHKDRLIVMDDSMRTLCRAYRERVGCHYPDSEYFFPAESENCFYDADWLNRTFHRCLKKARLTEFVGSNPRVYDFRHSFATKTLYRWLEEKRDLNSSLPYLSAFMGHDEYSDTAYYIHLVPEFFSQSSGVDFNRFSGLLPEVEQ